MSSSSQRIMRLGLGLAVSQALRATIELGLPDLLATGERPVEDLAAATQSNADTLYRIMRLLASWPPKASSTRRKRAISR